VAPCFCAPLARAAKGVKQLQTTAKDFVERSSVETQEQAPGIYDSIDQTTKLSLSITLSCFYIGIYVFRTLRRYFSIVHMSLS
jgi:hypothetical protein